jgi:hypothetical protein
MMVRGWLGGCLGWLGDSLGWLDCGLGVAWYWFGDGLGVASSVMVYGSSVVVQGWLGGGLAVVQR